MGSNDHKQDVPLQDQQAAVVDTYRFGWLDGYAQGYDDAVEDTENRLNDLENQNELLIEQNEAKDKLIDEFSSNAGRALQLAKRK
ncbi:hypothetical protein ACTG2C_04825 [Aeromonas veronii]